MARICVNRQADVFGDLPKKNMGYNETMNAMKICKAIGGSWRPADPYSKGDAINIIREMNASEIMRESAKVMKPRRVIYNNPATIVIWDDGTKTIVKCSPDTEFDPYTGFCAAVAKKLYGSSNAVHKAAGIPKEKQDDKCPCSQWAEGYLAGIKYAIDSYDKGR